MLSLKSFLFLLIATAYCHAKLTRRQLKQIHTAVAECGEDLDMKDYQSYELRATSGRQTVADDRFKKLLLCFVHRIEFMDCDGTIRKDNFGAFIADGHDNLDELPAMMQDCIDRVHGSQEDRAFQVYRCLYSSRRFKM